MSNKRANLHAGRKFFFLKRERGASLIEVLVAVLILAIGLMGIAGLQTRALKNGQSAFERSQAVTLSYLVLDAMRANVSAAETGAYNLTRTCAVSAAGTLVTSDQRLWLQSMKDTLGDRDTTCGEISCVGTQCTVRIYWDDSRGTEGSDNQMIETISVL
jgi:type IV pilus assembly protein PilV